MAVDPVFAQWLQDVALWSLGEDAAIKARWGATAIVAERATAIANQADAIAEAARQLAFMGWPLAEDQHLLPLGAGWSQFLGQVITLTGNGLGYEAGLDVFLISAEDDHSAGMSTLVVLRRL